MSHRATQWLASLPADQIGASEFRVLFHLCDCHNASGGCFPSQDYLRANAGVSNGTLNNVLNALEEKRLIQRHRSRDGRTHRQCPTHYILGFDIADQQGPTPETGDGNSGEGGPDRLQPDGDGAVSNLDAVPSPKNGKSRLQPAGEEPVIEPGNNRAGRAGRASGHPISVAETARFWAEKLAAGAFVPANAISIAVAQAMLTMKLVTETDLRRASIGF